MINIWKHASYLAAAAALFAAAACGSDDDGVDLGHGTGTGTQSGLTLKERNVAKRIEVPTLKSGNILISHWTREGSDSVMSFCYEYDKSAHHTRWVAYRFDGATYSTGTGRSDAWAEDPKLAAAGVKLGSGYFSGYQRGHICPSADRLYSVAANVQTFYTSNMSPQIGAFNGGVWADNEAFIRNLGRRCYPKNSSNYSRRFADTLYVVKGGTIADVNLEVGGVEKTVSGILTYSTMNGIRVPVPKYYFVALLKVTNGVYHSLAFWYPHQSSGVSEDPWDNAITIDELEQRTGIDFFSNLPDATEATVEATYNKSVWN